MKDYLERRNKEINKIISMMKDIRDREVNDNGQYAELFSLVVSELSYRAAKVPDEHNLCPKCETQISKAEYDNYCGFCGQFINKDKKAEKMRKGE